MNRGTALKWADALETTQVGYDSAQLGYISEGKRHLCPLGVLADFLDPDGWEVAHDGVSLLWHGEQFQLPKSARKRCKMKTDGFEVIEGINDTLRDPYTSMITEALSGINAEALGEKGKQKVQRLMADVSPKQNFSSRPRSLNEVMSEFSSHIAFSEFVRDNYAVI